MYYDIIHPRHFENLADAVCLHKKLTREQVMNARYVSGDLVVLHDSLRIKGKMLARGSTPRLCLDPFWLFPFEQRDSTCYAQRAIAYHKPLKGVDVEAVLAIFPK